MIGSRGRIAAQQIRRPPDAGQITGSFAHPVSDVRHKVIPRQSRRIISRIRAGYIGHRAAYHIQPEQVAEQSLDIGLIRADL